MEKRELIIEATSDLIAINGLPATPISLVAREAGCGAGTIYRYFDTKEVLIEAVYLALMDRFTEACLADMDESASIRDQISQMWLNVYHYLRTTPRDAALLDQLSVAPTIREGLQLAGKARLQARIHPLLDQGRIDGLIRDIPNDVLGIYVYGGLSTLLRSQRNQPGLNTNDVADETLLQLCWGSIGNPS